MSAPVSIRDLAVLLKGRLGLGVVVPGAAPSRLAPLPDFAVWQHPDGGERRADERKAAENRRRQVADKFAAGYGVHGTVEGTPTLRYGATALSNPAAQASDTPAPRTIPPPPRLVARQNLERIRAGRAQPPELDASEQRPAPDSEDPDRGSEKKRRRRRKRLVARRGIR